MTIPTPDDRLRVVPLASAAAASFLADMLTGEIESAGDDVRRFTASFAPILTFAIATDNKTIMESVARQGVLLAEAHRLRISASFWEQAMPLLTSAVIGFLDVGVAALLTAIPTNRD